MLNVVKKQDCQVKSLLSPYIDVWELGSNSFLHLTVFVFKNYMSLISSGNSENKTNKLSKIIWRRVKGIWGGGGGRTVNENGNLWRFTKLEKKEKRIEEYQSCKTFIECNLVKPFPHSFDI